MVDDFGIHPGSTVAIAGACWPETRVDSLMVSRCIVELQQSKLVMLYPAEGSEFVMITDWQTKWGQGGRAKQSRHPLPQSSEQYAMTFPVKSGLAWGLTADHLHELAVTFNHLSVQHHLSRAREWLIANRQRRKTPQQMPAFLRRWLMTAKDEPVRSGSGAPRDIDERLERR